VLGERLPEGDDSIFGILPPCSSPASPIMLNARLNLAPGVSADNRAWGAGLHEVADGLLF